MKNAAVTEAIFLLCIIHNIRVPTAPVRVKILI
jgi:hypothetical protein